MVEEKKEKDRFLLIIKAVGHISSMHYIGIPPLFYILAIFVCKAVYTKLNIIFLRLLFKEMRQENSFFFLYCYFKRKATMAPREQFRKKKATNINKNKMENAKENI